MSFKVGDYVRTNKGFSFDPAYGKVVGVTPPRSYQVKIIRSTLPNQQYFYRQEKNRWNYNESDLSHTSKEKEFLHNLRK